MSTNYELLENDGYVKYTNRDFEVIVKSNHSIIVIDKRDPLKQTIYNNLRTAYKQLFMT